MIEQLKECISLLTDTRLNGQLGIYRTKSKCIEVRGCARPTALDPLAKVTDGTDVAPESRTQGPRGRLNKACN